MVPEGILNTNVMFMTADKTEGNKLTINVNGIPQFGKVNGIKLIFLVTFIHL